MKEFYKKLQNLHVETGTSPTDSVQCECHCKTMKEEETASDSRAAKNTGHRAALETVNVSLKTIYSLYSVLQGLLYIWHFKLNYALT